MADQAKIREAVAARLAETEAAEGPAAKARAQTEQWVRERWGGEGLPPGQQGDTMECVLAHALGGSWDGSSWDLPADRLAAKLGFTSVTVPGFVGEFVRFFDSGAYPDLIEALPACDEEEE